MRHRNRINALSRTQSHRKAMIRNLCESLLKHGSIKTTHPKARVAQKKIEKVISTARFDNLHNRRVINKYIFSKKLLNHLFTVIGVNARNRPGGYTRIIKLKHRAGDNATIVLLELLDKHSSLNASTSSSYKKELASASK